MRCDDVQERLVELLYDEPGSAPPDSILKEHVNSCAKCRRELDELRDTRRVLKLWKDDEEPFKHPTILRTPKISSYAFGSAWQIARFGAIAAMALLSILALANTHLTWNDQGLSLSTHIFSAGSSSDDYYTKAEVRDILKRALDDSEARMYETNSLMIQEALETMEREQYAYFRFASAKTNQRPNVN